MKLTLNCLRLLHNAVLLDKFWRNPWVIIGTGPTPYFLLCWYFLFYFCSVSAGFQFRNHEFHYFTYFFERFRINSIFSLASEKILTMYNFFNFHLQIPKIPTFCLFASKSVRKSVYYVSSKLKICICIDIFECLKRTPTIDLILALII